MKTKPVILILAVIMMVFGAGVAFAKPDFGPPWLFCN